MADKMRWNTLEIRHKLWPNVSSLPMVRTLARNAAFAATVDSEVSVEAMEKPMPLKVSMD